MKLRSVDKQVGGFVMAQSLCGLGLTVFRQRQRGNTISQFSCNVQSLAAACYYLYTRTGANQRVCELRASGKKVFAIVQDQQQALSLESVGERMCQGLAGLFGYAKSLRDRLRNRDGSVSGASSTSHAPSE